MENEIILGIILCSIIAGYCSLMILYYFGWARTKNKMCHKTIASCFISIIVPFRNEEENIETLLKCLLSQDYPKENYEVILVNDHSTDNSVSIVNDFANKNTFLIIKVINLEINQYSKKAAVREGILQSKGKLIISTDADCWMGEKWLKGIAEFYAKTGANFISAPVQIVGKSNFFESFQQIEFAGLIGSGAGSIYLKKPLMCNGANLAFERSLFLKIDQIDLRQDYASGEDVFLMLSAKKNRDVTFAFIKSKESIVFTSPQNSIGSFIRQRKRWVSKSKGYRDLWIVFNSIIVFLMNLSILSTGIAMIFNISYLKYFIIFFLSKFIVDFFLLNSVLSFFGKSKLLRWYLITQIVNSIYVPFIGIYGIIGKYHWKGRKVS